MTVRASKTSGPDGSVTPKPLEQRLEPDGGQHAQPEADQRRHQPDDRPPRAAPSGRPGGGWPRRCAAGPAPRVRWPTMMENVLRMVKPPTKSAMKREDEQGGVEEAQRLADGAGLLVDHGLTGHHLDAARAGRGRCRAGPCALSAPGCGDDVDGVELARPRRGPPAPSGGRRRPAWRRPGCSAVPKRTRPVMVKVRVGPSQQDAHLLAHLEVVLLGRAQVHHDVVGGRGRACPAARRRAESCWFGIEGDPEGGRAAGGDRLAVRGDELRVAGHRALGRLPRPGTRAHRGQRATRGWGCGCAAAAAGCRTAPRRGPGSRRSGRCCRTAC